ncbi:dynamin family protein [Paenibacillus albiflavus]|uniref:Dynamin family protein n=1 Tax=Paenibacillus albiflavus TaxID=2545760 RepID=A0A4R4EM69_9BACL|nr:dynamin family protein [Paenibacillus albiflavus]TCZ81149.1 dynamin family protein [Paenibacillus albiflavus]
MTVPTIDQQGLSSEAMLKMLTDLKQYMQMQQDKTRESQFEGLIRKREQNRFYISFCGHFSAGKSTLINHLCGKSLLPSSPIPTSANIVSIANGPIGAVVYERDEAGDSATKKSIPLEELAAYCVDGKGIERVEITHELPFLGDDGVLLDTPGIDSTDDAHHMATESALYLADVVFYVMDYNHVQSEMNLSFAKQMKERGKPLYLIVNMIDKHREEELPFSTYREGVASAFHAWGIKPDGILYVTMKAPQHPHNEYGKLRALVAQLIAQGAELSSYSVDEAARHLLEEHREARAQQLAPRIAELDEAMRGEGAALAEQRAELQRIVAAAKEEPQRLQAALRREVIGIVDNANVTPAATRDVAQHYLQSRAPGFKVGFLARASKTAAEATARLDKLHVELVSSVSTQLERHLQSLLREAVSKGGYSSAPLLSPEIDAIHLELTPEWLAGQVNTAAVFGNEYTINYMKQVANEIKVIYRKKAYEVIDLIMDEAEKSMKQQEQAHLQEIASLSERLAAYDGIVQLKAQEAKEDQQLYALCGSVRARLPELPDLANLAVMSDNEPTTVPLPTASIDVVLQASHTIEHLDQQGSDASIDVPSSQVKLPRADEVKQRAAAFLSAASTMEEIPALKQIARSLADKANRLMNQTYTIALFGAFSAGKSSFANALIGERVLPVSPNPTTAAINRIMAPQPNWPHGTAKVTMKKQEALLSDVIYSLELLGVKVTQMSEALQAIARLSPDQVTAKAKPHYSFLRAVLKGWSDAEPLLGSEVRANHEQFTAYVAEESKSCFIEGIELYYSSPLTDQGIVFVDTPGADSINARHTGVAFNYIKNADAILFVTYYNHAFSHADKEFLLQLGRVKDAFELDKMFFIVNAADLASSEEELNGVVKHVESNLLAHGIRHPRIYPISSQNAADGKLKKDQALLYSSGILPFEQEFTSYAFQELSQIAIQSAEAELQRGIHALDRWIKDMQSSDEERSKRISHLLDMQVKAMNAIEAGATEELQREIRREISELLYYVKQRTMYRYSELFAYAFNPSVFRDEGRDSKTIMAAAWKELLAMISFDLEQEGLATTLRIEKAIHSLISAEYVKWGQIIQSFVEDYEYEGFEPSTLPTPAIRVEVEAPEVSIKLLSGFFKNAKQFFESDGRSKLKNELERHISEGVSREMIKLEAKLIEIYCDYLEAAIQKYRGLQLEGLEEHIQGSISALEMKVDYEFLYAKRQSLAVK